MVGLAGEGQNFDGNGMYVRFQPGGGDQTISTGAPRAGSADKLFANAILKPLGTRPAFPGKRPPYKPDVPCYKNPLPDLSGARRRGAARRRAGAARRRAAAGQLDGWERGADEDGDPQARARLRLRPGPGRWSRRSSAATSSSNQRFYLPHWVPVVGSDFVDYKAQFSTAQSVTPGQGQTVQIAGVDVGDITKVDLVDGRAVVTMKIRRKYTPIYKNATALLRPKTGLNDMVIELDPGSQSADTAPAGLDRPHQPDAAQRQLRRDPLLAGHRYAHLPAAARRRRGRGARRPGQGPVGRPQALRADRPLPGQAQRRAGRARAQHPPLDPQLQPALAGAGQQGRRPGGAGRLLQPGLPGVRQPGRQPARRVAGAARRPGRDEHHAGQGRQAGPGARADPRRPATRRPRPRARRWSRRARS